MHVSWKHQHTDFALPLSLDDKISLFREKVWGWHLHIAELCLNGGTCHSGKNAVQKIPHSAFGALQIMLSYFEMIAKYQAGFIPSNPRNGESARHFKMGFESVFHQQIQKIPPESFDGLLDSVYEKLRCGLYHMSQTEEGIVLTDSIDDVILVDADNKQICIDPHKLPGILKSHLDDYVVSLQNPTNNLLRSNFEKRFNYDNKSLTNLP